jgi:hypothetical protein
LVAGSIKAGLIRKRSECRSACVVIVVHGTSIAGYGL